MEKLKPKGSGKVMSCGGDNAIEEDEKKIPCEGCFVDSWRCEIWSMG